MNAVDIDQDGWTDIFVCNDIGYNVVLWNIKGQFAIDTTNLFGELQESDAPGNYGSVWSDFDQDGDPDLYISKCKAGADVGDLRRKNQFYNNREGEFVSRAENMNVDYDDQSWTSDFFDFDNDGDFDLWVTNHLTNSLLIENRNGFFIDVTPISNISYICAVSQSLTLDINKDGWLDIITVGGPEFMHYGSPDLIYEEVYQPFEPYMVKSLAYGDFNHDAKIDLYATYGKGVEDRFWLNNYKDQHHLDVYVKGVESDMDGIGTRLKLYGAWGIQTREIRCGESYGISNSYVARFGMGSHETADSLVIVWASGKKQVVTDLSSNQYIHAVEGLWAIQSPPGFSYYSEICLGDTAELMAPPGFQYQWSTGDNGQGIMASESGFYQVKISKDGLSFYTLPGTEILMNPEIKPEIIFLSGDSVVCFGEEIIITCSNTSNLTWWDGGHDLERNITTSGSYSATVQGACDEMFDTEQVNIRFLDAPANSPKTENDTVATGEDALLIAEGGNIIWFESPNSEEIIHRGDSLILKNVTEDQNAYAANATIPFLQRVRVGKVATGNSTLEGASLISFFEANKDFKIISVDVYSQRTGERRIVIADFQGNEIWSYQAVMDTGFLTIPVNFNVQKSTRGLYQMYTDERVNEATFGVPFPFLEWSEDDIDFPYSALDLMQIINTSQVTIHYGHFFNWLVSPIDVICTGPRTEAWAIVDTTSGSLDHLPESLVVYPNPIHDYLKVQCESCTLRSISMFSIDGTLNKVYPISDGKRKFEISTQSLLPGIYFMKIVTSQGRYYTKIIRS